MEITDEAIENNDYGLEKWTLKEGSESAMIAELKEKYENQQPIIITGWNPHWIFKDMELKMLEDPDDIYGSEEDEHNLMRRIFIKGDNKQKVAEDFVERNSNKVDKWIENVEKI